MKTKIVNGYTRYYNDNDKYLMSYSTMSKPFTQDKFDSIPRFILEKATEFGRNMSNLLLEALGGQEIGNYTPDLLLCLKSLLKCLKTLNLTPLTCEKHVWNEKWHGYLDLDCEDYFVEVKTRSKCDLELNTVIQTEIYKRITGKDYYIIYINKKTGETKAYSSRGVKMGQNEIPQAMIEQARAIIDAFEYIYDNVE